MLKLHNSGKLTSVTFFFQKLCAETSESVQKLRAQKITFIFTSLPFRPMGVYTLKNGEHTYDAYQLLFLHWTTIKARNNLKLIRFQILN